MDFRWMLMFVLQLSWHLVLLKTLPSVMFQLYSRLICEDHVVKCLLLPNALVE